MERAGCGESRQSDEQYDLPTQIHALGDQAAGGALAAGRVPRYCGPACTTTPSITVSNETV